MYSLNVAMPAAVARLATDLAGDLPGSRVRERGTHSLLVKRLGDGTDGRPDHLVSRARDALAGTDPFEIRVTGVDWFEEPETGTGPVVYLAVESPPLVALHDRLCETFEPVPHFEGAAYTPHVTVARGGDPDAARRLTERRIEPHTVTVTEIALWDAKRDVAAARFSLPR